MNTFLTGSHAYGTPREDSDIDLCLLVPEEVLRTLMDLSEDSDSGEYADASGESLRFGKLNLLCFADPDYFAAWRDATVELVARKPVTREQAVEAIEAKVQCVTNARWEAEGQALADAAAQMQVDAALLNQPEDAEVPC